MCSTCSGYGGRHDTWANIDGQGIMAFVNLQANVEDHDPGNANEGKEVVIIEVECVEALVDRGVGFVLT